MKYNQGAEGMVVCCITIPLTFNRTEMVKSVTVGRIFCRVRGERSFCFHHLVI